jgi:hypothetical protein
MNRGMILELKGEQAIVLTPKGEFRAIKKRKHQIWQIGEEIDLPPAGLSEVTKKRKVFIPSIALAASLLLVFVSIFTFLPFGGDQTAIAYVSVDINPSVEISINKSLEVIDLVGLNQEGRQIVSIMDDWSGEPLDQVTMNMILMARDQGYLTENQDILVSTSFVDEQSESLYVESIDIALQAVEKKVKHASELAENQVAKSEENNQQTAQNQADNNAEKEKAIQIHQLKTEKEVRIEAKEKGISPGKYSIYLEAVEQGVEIDLEDVVESSISQLAQKLKGLSSILSDKPSKQDKEKKVKDEEEDDERDNNEKNGNKKNRPNHGSEKDNDDSEYEETGKKHPRENGQQRGKKDKEDEDEDRDEDEKGNPGHPSQGNKDKKGPPHKDDKGKGREKNNQDESEDQLELDLELELELQHPKIPGILNQIPGLLDEKKGHSDERRDKQNGEANKKRNGKDRSEKNNKGNTNEKNGDMD